MTKWIREFLIGGGALAAAVALLAWGSMSEAVDTHISADGLHLTIAQATATAEKVARMESAVGANAEHLKQIDTDVMEIQEDIGEIKESQHEQALAAKDTAADIRVILQRLEP